MAKKHSNGIRGHAAKAISDLRHVGRKKTLVQRATSDLTDAATDVRRRLRRAKAAR